MAERKSGWRIREVHLGVGCRKISMAARLTDVTCVREGNSLKKSGTADKFVS